MPQARKPPVERRTWTRVRPVAEAEPEKTYRIVPVRVVLASGAVKYVPTRVEVEVEQG
jgi:hypothetical protein